MSPQRSRAPDAVFDRCRGLQPVIGAATTGGWHSVAGCRPSTRAGEISRCPLAYVNGRECACSADLHAGPDCRFGPLNSNQSATEQTDELVLEQALIHSAIASASYLRRSSMIISTPAVITAGGYRHAANPSLSWPIEHLGLKDQDQIILNSAGAGRITPTPEAGPGGCPMTDQPLP